MTSTKQAGRFAGIMYFVSSLPAPFSLLYIPSVFLVPGDATATANKIRASELLFRAGIAAELLSAGLFIWVAVAMYKLFRDVNRSRALALMILILVSVPISYLNELNRVAAVMFARGGSSLANFTQPQLDGLVMNFLRLHSSGVVLAQIFWGLWLFPFALLIFQSRYLPRILGVLLICAGIGYVATSATSLLFPGYSNSVFRAAAVAGGLGEGGTMLWLMIMGAKEQPARAAA